VFFLIKGKNMVKLGRSSQAQLDRLFRACQAMLGIEGSEEENLNLCSLLYTQVEDILPKHPRIFFTFAPFLI
jgi:hypothetical protein